jgi:putative copper resistance protein D
VDPLLWLRVIASFGVDAALAVLCGLLLSAFWLRPDSPMHSTNDRFLWQPLLQASTAALFFALCAQLILLSASFSGQTDPQAVFAALPDVLSTHAGRIISLTIAVAVVLLSTTLLRIAGRMRLAVCSTSLLLCFVLRSTTGHAATDGDFTTSELLQLFHLTGMALWSGGVLVSGLLVIPRLSSTASLDDPVLNPASPNEPRDTTSPLRRYLQSLSILSTWAVLVVALTGLIKSYRATGGTPHLLLHNLWGYILIAKIISAAAALTLGALNRCRLTSAIPWGKLVHRRAARTLRAEAYIMAVILLLSAWLANMPPPGE